MPKRYPIEQRERVVKMVLDRLDGYPSAYAACQALAPKLGVHAGTLRVWGEAVDDLGGPPWQLSSGSPPRDEGRSWGECLTAGRCSTTNRVRSVCPKGVSTSTPTSCNTENCWSSANSGDVTVLVRLPQVRALGGEFRIHLRTTGTWRPHDTNQFVPLIRRQMVTGP